MEEKELAGEMPDLVTLSDDEGNEFTLEVLDEADLEDAHYVALLPVYEDPADMLDDSEPLVIMRQTSEEDGEYFEEIEDETEFDKVFNLFSARLSEIFDVEE